MRLDSFARDHRSSVLWATACAEHVLPYFEEKYPKDNLPRDALEAGRARVRSEIAMSEVYAAALAAHAAVRDADQDALRGRALPRRSPRRDAARVGLALLLRPQALHPDAAGRRFPAMEEPELLAEDIRSFLRPFGSNLTSSLASD
jgi:hypothetical protein